MSRGHHYLNEYVYKFCIAYCDNDIRILLDIPTRDIKKKSRKYEIWIHDPKTSLPWWQALEAVVMKTKSNDVCQETSFSLYVIDL